MKAHVVYGLAVVRPALHATITQEPLKWTDVLRGFLAELWFMVTQAALFAASATCFAFAFGAFR